MLLSFLIIVLSCKKIDKTNGSAVEEFPKNWKEQFFLLPNNPHPALVRVADEIRRQSNGTTFLENFIKTNGFIRWDKAEVFVKKHKRNIAALESGENQDTLILLPTVPWLQEIVKSVVAVKMDGEISFKTYLDKFYQANGFDLDPDREKPNADDVVKKIMEFEKGLFGTEQYKVSDKRLFKYITSASASNESFIYKLIAMSIPDDGGECLIYTEYTSEDGGLTWTEGDSWESPSCSPDNPLVGGGGGGGGSVDWGTDSDPVFGDGGGSTNPDSTGNAPVDCIPWVKLRETNGNYDYNTPAPCVVPDLPIVSVDSSFKKFLDSIAVSISTQSDSVFNWALKPTNNFREQGGIIVRKGDSTYLKNLRPGHDTKTKAIDYTLESGEEMIGYFHTHPVDTDSLIRSFFSDDDFLEFHKNARTKPKFIAFLECGNKRFAIVVENLQKYQEFMTFNRLMQLRRRHIENELTTSQPTFWSNGQKASTDAAIQFFGTSSSCGLGFYVANGPDKTNFIKLNP